MSELEKTHSSGCSKVEVYKIKTEEKYVLCIFDSSGSTLSGDKVISIYVRETEDSELITHEIFVDNYPDLVEIVPLKHEYCIVLVYNVWGLPTADYKEGL